MGVIKNFVSGMSGKQKGVAGGITGMGIASAALDGGATYYFDQMENPENSQALSAAKGIATGAAWLVAEPLMWGVTLGQGAVGLGNMMLDDAREQRDAKQKLDAHVKTDATGRPGGTLGGNFVDNQQTATMRQRQMDLLRQHKMSTESILGSEARQLHR